MVRAAADNETEEMKKKKKKKQQIPGDRRELVNGYFAGYVKGPGSAASFHQNVGKFTVTAKFTEQ